MKHLWVFYKIQKSSRSFDRNFHKNPQKCFHEILSAGFSIKSSRSFTSDFFLFFMLLLIYLFYFILFYLFAKSPLKFVKCKNHSQKGYRFKVQNVMASPYLPTCNKGQTFFNLTSEKSFSEGVQIQSPECHGISIPTYM